MSFKKIFMLCFCLMGGYSHLSLAAPSSKQTSVATKDPRILLAHRFFRCFQSGQCQLDELLYGSLLKKMKSRFPRMRKRFELLKFRTVDSFPEKYIRRYKRTWFRTLAKLQKAGYNIEALKAVGLGKAVANAGPLVSLVFTSSLTKRKKDGRTKEQFSYFVLWKIKEHWSIAFIEDFPARWMAKNKPPGFKPTQHSK